MRIQQEIQSRQSAVTQSDCPSGGQETISSRETLEVFAHDLQYSAYDRSASR